MADKNNFLTATGFLGDVDGRIGRIPRDVQELLWVGNRARSDEPSWIDPRLPICTDVAEQDACQDIGYYPSYKNLTPKQRFIYLLWLSDIDQKISIGYVFIFYYGLERHLLSGNFEMAFEMVERLRRIHNNNSFQAYSADALVLSSLLHNRVDLLKRSNIGHDDLFMELLVSGMCEKQYSPEQLMKMCRKVGFTNTRYLKGEPERFRAALSSVLTEMFGCPSFLLSGTEFLKSKNKRKLAIANYSLVEIGIFAEAPDITSCSSFATKASEALKKAHEIVKTEIKAERSP